MDLEFPHFCRNRLNISEDAVNEIFECVLFGTLMGVSPGDNVRIAMFLLEELIRLANVDGFKSMFFATANPFMRVSLEYHSISQMLHFKIFFQSIYFIIFLQDLLMDVFDFKILDDYIANEYTSDGACHPFHVAPSTVSVASLHKVIRVPITISLTETRSETDDGDVKSRKSKVNNKA